MLYENIRVKMLSMKIFFQILFVWQFSSEFEKNSNKNNNIEIVPPHTHTHIKIQHAKGSIIGSQGKGTHIFYKAIKLV